MNEDRIIASSQEIDLDPVKRLMSVLQDDDPVLMVGSGSSKIVGYPSWPELIKELNELTPSLQLNEGEDLLCYAEKIKTQLKNQGKIEKYYEFLRNRFEPKEKYCDKFHQSLLKLNFSGIVTTNYDKVLELAIFQSRCWCESIDLCSPEALKLVWKLDKVFR